MNPLPVPPSPEDRSDDLRVNSTGPNVIDFTADGPGDNTIRPCRAERRAALEAERELLRQWEGTMNIRPVPPGVESACPNVIDFTAEGPGDNTIRPCRPERRAALEAERELLRKWGVLGDPPKQSDDKEGAA